MFDRIKNQRGKRKINRQWAINFLGGKCSNCNSIENLEFDHKNPKDKKCNISLLLSSSREVLLIELEKCQLLCSRCHIKKTKQNKHGNITMYTHRKCRCCSCVSFWKKYNRIKMREFRKEKTI